MVTINEIITSKFILQHEWEAAQNIILHVEFYPWATIEKLNGIKMNYFKITYHQLIVAELHKVI